MIKGEVSGDEQVIEKLKTIPKTVRARLLETVTRLTIDLQGYIVRRKLSGQVLKRRTGTLAASIQPRVDNDARGVIGIVASRAREGAPLKYARIHEYGFSGPVTVKEHLRMQTMAWGKLIEPRQVTVRQHIMNMNMPERSFMRTSLHENEENIRAKIKKALGDGVKS